GHGVSFIICRVASYPSITGILISIVTRSGLRRCTMRTASAPLLAVPITWIPGDFSNRETNALRQMVESSATTTRMGEERLPGRSEGFVALVMVGNALTFFCVASPGSALL